MSDLASPSVTERAPHERRSEQVVRTLFERGELWEPAPGLTSLRGDLLRLANAIEGCFSAVAEEGGFGEWRVAPGIRVQTLRRARFFETFPHWLTMVGHFEEPPVGVGTAPHTEAVPGRAAAPGRSAEPGCSAAPGTGAAPATGTEPFPEKLEPSNVALPSALCYHAYQALSDRTTAGLRMTVSGRCWRREEKEARPLERGRSFTMRELVRVGSPEEVRDFRGWSTERVSALAARLGLTGRVVRATDPFYAPTARGQKLLQQVKGLKTELLLDIGDGRAVAAASFNDHEHFFGSCFGITLPDGATASSGCTAFGLERWMLAFLVTHGVEPSGWPDVTGEQETG